MKKYIVFFGLVLGSFSGAFSQYFFQGAFGYDVETVVGTKIDGLESRGKSIDLQIGRFVNERKMRSFSASYTFGFQYLKDKGSFYMINGKQESGETRVKYSTIRLAYERKVCYANTEFDDVWNIYSIISYGVSLISVKAEYTNSIVKQNVRDTDSGTGFNIDFGIGTGVARKINLNTYVFGDFTASFPAADLYAPISVKLGVRKLF